MEILSSGSIVAQLRKRFGTRGDSSVALESVIMPVVNLGDLDGPPWNAKRGAMGTGIQAGVAAQFAYVGIKWPTSAAQDSVFVVRRLLITPSISESVRIGFTDDPGLVVAIGGLAYGSPSGSWNQETEMLSGVASVNVLTSSQLQIGVASNAAAPATTQQMSMQMTLPATVTVVEGPFVIRRGAVLVVQGQTVNVTLTVTAYGDEYTAE